MQELIKQIRSYLNMSQTEFAERVNVTYLTVNRWENGHSLPNRLAQSKVYEVCKAENVPVYDMTLERIRGIAGNTALPNGWILLYHGSKSGIEGKIEPKSRPQCDFGRGFYMGTEASQALTLICDYEESKLYLTSVNLNGLRVTEIPADIEWAMVVAYNRGKMERIAGTPFYEKYRNVTQNADIVIGSIADDRMFYVIDNFFLGNITDAALVGSLSALQLGKQYVAVSEKGCEAVKIEKKIEISWLERQFIRDVSEKKRVKGVLAANEICRNHRRDGLFFDELLERAENGDA